MASERIPTELEREIAIYEATQPQIEAQIVEEFRARHEEDAAKTRKIEDDFFAKISRGTGGKDEIVWWHTMPDPQVRSRLV